MGQGPEDNVVRGQFGRRRRATWTKASDFRTNDTSERTGFRGYDAQQKAKQKRQRKQTWAPYLALWAGAVFLGGAYGVGAFDGLGSRFGARAASESGQRVNFSFCHVGGGYNCVVDGDTIWLKGQKIRIADIDTPETHDFKCASEKERGDRATRRLLQLLNNGAVALQPIDRDEDNYGRKLRIVLVDGTSVGDTLVGEGLARWYGSGRQPWC